jgi:putative flippase GtrA
VAKPGVLDKPIVTKLVKYAMASMVGVVCGQSLLLLFYGVLDWPVVLANVSAVTLSSIPAYLVNRYWVWQKTDTNDFKREVLPFWGMAFLGLILSSIFTYWVDQRTDSPLAVGIANLAGFGVLWIAKFFILDKVLFAQVGHDPAEPPPIL